MKKMLTIKKANAILIKYKPEAKIIKLSNDTLYHIEYNKNGINYPFDSCMNLYDILLEVLGFIEDLEEYRRFYRPTVEELTGRENQTEEERQAEIDDFFGL